MSYGADDWSDSAHHDYQYELTQLVEAISVTMRARFSEWARQLVIPESGSLSVKSLPLEQSAHFLTFNYTRTLQQTYGIADDRIVHIHGQAANPKDSLVLGHGWARSESDSLNYRIDHESADTRVIEGNSIIDEYFSATFKPTHLIIQQRQPFFRALKAVRQILVLGHSLADVDLPYFREVIKNIDTTVVRWKISYHRDSSEAQAQMLKLGVNPALVSFVRLEDL